MLSRNIIVIILAYIPVSAPEISMYLKCKPMYSFQVNKKGPIIGEANIINMFLYTLQVELLGGNMKYIFHIHIYL